MNFQKTSTNLLILVYLRLSSPLLRLQFITIHSRPIMNSPFYSILNLVPRRCSTSSVPIANLASCGLLVLTFQDSDLDHTAFWHSLYMCPKIYRFCI